MPSLVNLAGKYYLALCGIASLQRGCELHRVEHLCVGCHCHYEQYSQSHYFLHNFGYYSSILWEWVGFEGFEGFERFEGFEGFSLRRAA